MSAFEATTGSWRSARLRALAPRALFYAFIAILCVAGLRSILDGPAESAPAPRVIARGPDVAALAFAETLTREYLSWEADDSEERERRLAGFLPESLADGGLTPAEGTSQQVEWTSVVGAQRVAGRLIVTVAARTSAGLTYLSVPITRNERGFLSVAGYPALVGPPPTDRTSLADDEEEVEDTALTTVVERAITNYLAGARPNLMADLAPSAVVSLPSQQLDVERADTVTWVQLGRRVAVETEATDPSGTAWILRYELEVIKHDRWYVRSIEVDPTFKGGGS